MFRRFMIVCWVLFAIPAITFVTLYAMHSSYESKLIELRRSSTMGAEATPYKVRNDLAGFYFAMLEYAVSRADSGETEWQQFVPDRPWDHYPPDFANAKTIRFPENLTAEEFAEKFWTTKKDYESAKDLYPKLDATLVPMWLAGALALIVLAWNTIWHVGHWIWMGRKHVHD